MSCDQKGTKEHSVGQYSGAFGTGSHTFLNSGFSRFLTLCFRPSLRLPSPGCASFTYQPY
ncbi:hypothetical protein BB559_006242 [Furculomyces boomerangus]|uniref:Uncharacterized protein n=1 Tax=Furculomyces boomerangus TaxID=61424 RepID=A0A2T9Y3Z7_9FUNG|nr:hypothetical protein BB559_006242 [Furculomyces boomerangus]